MNSAKLQPFSEENQGIAVCVVKAQTYFLNFFLLTILSWLPAMSNFGCPEADFSSLHMTVLDQFFLPSPCLLPF